MDANTHLSILNRTSEMPTPPAPTLGLDFVGTISAVPEFFRILSNAWPGRVVIISCFDSVEELEHELANFNIRYDKAIAVPLGVSKAKIIEEENVMFYFDDSVSNLHDIPEATATFLVRNEDNFNFNRGRWMINPQYLDQ